MTRITALVHAFDDALRLGRALDSLRPCDEVIVIDHGSADDSVKVAREHGALVKPAVPGVEPGCYAVDATHDWVLCILPSEALSEGLEASLHAWKFEEHNGASAFGVGVREESGIGWKTLAPEIRLVNRELVHWHDPLPPADHQAPLLHGDLLRFHSP